MIQKPLLTIAVAAILLRSHAYSYRSDFSVTDEAGFAPSIETECRTGFSHRHCEVRDGSYAITVAGNRHFLATPRLKDFRLDVRLALKRLVRKRENDFGFKVFFRDDRVANPGHELGVFWDGNDRLAMTLDGKFLLRDVGKAVPDGTAMAFALKVSGGRGEASFAGERVAFCIGDDEAPGYVGFDIHYAPATTLVLHDVALDTMEEPPLERVGNWQFRLGDQQGFVREPVVDVSIGRYATGEARLTATLSGTQRDRGTNRLETGGAEWCTFLERLTSPYVRVVGPGGASRKLRFWTGMKQLCDPLLQARKIGDAAWEEQVQWPFRMDVVLREFPKEFQLAAGYERAICSPWRFAADGPCEQVADARGRVLYSGEALGNGRVGVKAVSPSDKRIAALVPKDVPGREAALRHAREQHYFFESERITFDVETHASSADYASGELNVDFSMTDVYARKTLDGVTATKLSEEELPGGFRRMVHRVSLAGNLKCGVWHLYADIKAGGRTVRRSRTIFEVLSDDPNGPCPPLASGLPEFVSMPNEIKYLEQDAFDPWSSRGGISHYYTTVNRYPAVGNVSEIWKLLPLYRRRWFCWSWRRNTGERDIRNEFNRELISHCDVFGGEENGTPVHERFDFSYLRAYGGEQMKILRDYLSDRRISLGALDAAEADKRLKEGGPALDSEELRKLVEGPWEDFIGYARPRADNFTAAFDDYVFGINPRVGRGGYGPMSVYTSCYKSAYDLRTCGRSVNQDPRVRANRSFFILEEYHFSCDYPICRASFYATSYDMLYPNGRRLYPEIYNSGWTRCLDGAVFRAHPNPATPISARHQRRIVYQYGYGTPHFTNGSYKYWTDDGFHVPEPDEESMDEFVSAWGNLVENRPVKSPKAPFVVVDPEAFSRHGDYFEDECSLFRRSSADTRTRVWPNVCNTAEEGVAWAFEKCALAGYATPVMTRLADLESISCENAEFVILPPIVEGTPSATIAAIRRLHARGVGLYSSEAVVGLEDLFGVKANPDGAVPLRWIPGERQFEHKRARATYLADGAEVLLAGASSGGSACDVPVVMTHRTPAGRTAFVNVPPSTVRRLPCRDGVTFGQPSLSEPLARAMVVAVAFLAPRPALKTERGSLLTGESADGTLVVALGDDAPIYHDSGDYPVAFRFAVRLPGIGLRTVKSDAPYDVVSRRDDEIVLRAFYEKDGAPYFLFAPLETRSGALRRQER